MWANSVKGESVPSRKVRMAQDDSSLCVWVHSMKMNAVEKAICTFLDISRLRAFGNLSWRDATEHLVGKWSQNCLAESRVIHSPSRVVHSHGGQKKKKRKREKKTEKTN